MNYSIIIPIYNEERILPRLLYELKSFEEENEIIFIDDGSNDNSLKILKSNRNIKIIKLKKNLGKGVALRVGIKNSNYSKIIIFDGDLELKTSCLLKLMILNRSKRVYSALGFRFKNQNPIQSGFSSGNFIFTVFFNLLYNTTHKDILCCAKSFYKEDIQLNRLKSIGFDIDVELTSFLTRNNRKKSIPQVLIGYKRRTISEGKKLQVFDGWKILKRIILDFLS